jgi:Tripartite tricarboxylate transporter family receptor
MCERSIAGSAFGSGHAFRSEDNRHLPQPIAACPEAIQPIASKRFAVRSMSFRTSKSLWLPCRTTIRMGSARHCDARSQAPAPYVGVCFLVLLRLPCRGAISLISARPDTMVDLVAGRMSFVFGPSLTTNGQIQGGAVRALGVSAPGRFVALGELPTLDEAASPGFVSQTWNTIAASADTPKEIVTALNDIIQSDAMRVRLEELASIVPAAKTPAEVDAYCIAQREIWIPVMRGTGACAEGRAWRPDPAPDQYRRWDRLSSRRLHYVQSALRPLPPFVRRSRNLSWTFPDGRRARWGASEPPLIVALSWGIRLYGQNRRPFHRRAPQTVLK